MRVTSAIPFCVVALAFAACATNPVTGKKQLSLISESQEIEMGRQAAADVDHTIGLVDDPELQAYVMRVGLDLAHASERPALPWHFAVVDDATPNAFALPGGFIYVTRGLTTLMDSEAELATVLGHEIGHVTARHSVSQISQQQVAQLGLGIGGVLVPKIQKYSDAVGGGLGLLFLRFSRDAERQADDLGFRYALGRGYSVSEMANVFRSLERISPDGGALPTFLETHPSPGERVVTVTQKVNALPENGRGTRIAKAEYLHQIDGLVYGNDPRQGFFRGAEFLHPGLRFRFTLPDGWTGQNLREAVMGGNAAGNAALQLTIPGAMPPPDAAAAFAKQTGVTLSGSHAQTINGIAAVVGTFEATGDSGPLAGTAAWLDYEGHTYELLAYTTRDAMATQADSFRKVVESFAPLRDAAILNVKPNIVSVVSLPTAQTLMEFSQRQPSMITIEELAIINEVAGPSTVLAQGVLAKRVVGGVVGPVGR